jgi:hypothetical protein
MICFGENPLYIELGLGWGFVATCWGFTPTWKEEPSKFVKRKLDFRGSQHAQRESQPSIGSQPLGVGGREESSKTTRKMSWVEEGRKEGQKREACRSRVSSRKGPC